MRETCKLAQRNLDYKERQRAAISRASKKWIKANPLRRAIARDLAEQVRKGVTTRPDTCQDCGKPCRPVAYRDPLTLLFVAWTCWRCYWRRKLSSSP